MKISFLEINQACVIVFTVLSQHMIRIFSVPEARGPAREITIATAGVVAASTAVAAASIETTAGLH